jgi:hypothetical protein
MHPFKTTVTPHSQQKEQARKAKLERISCSHGGGLHEGDPLEWIFRDVRGALNEGGGGRQRAGPVEQAVPRGLLRTSREGRDGAGGPRAWWVVWASPPAGYLEKVSFYPFPLDYLDNLF